MNIVETQLWYKNAIFYEVYVRGFNDSNADGHGDLAGLTQKLDYLQDLGIDCIWLLPIFPSPLNDDGYDIADYYGVLPEYGKLNDLKSLIAAAHGRGMRIITDLVLNHTSDQHPWFQAARADRESPYRDYYVWSDTDHRYSDARIIFLDTEKSNWTWDDFAGQYFWHRFYSSQPDLNYDNPAVQDEMLKIMKFWIDIGIDGFRVDAVPYLFEREGTNCENLPETHAYMKEIRRYIDANYPGRILLAEANQWPEDVRPYFGEGDEFHMGFHFPLMPRIFMALRKEDKFPIKWILEQTPDIPSNCQWCTFLRNHDELTLEMVTEEERIWMWNEYAPNPRMRLNLGIRRRLAPLLDNDQRKIELAYSLLFSLPGAPIIYYGDELSMGDNIWLDDRNGVRTPMQWEAKRNAGFSSAEADALYTTVIDDHLYGPKQVNAVAQRDDPESLFNIIRNMISVRKQHTAFGEGDINWQDVGSDAVAAYCREYAGEKLFIINNLSANPQKIDLGNLDEEVTQIISLISKYKKPFSGSGRWELEPYEYLWLKYQ
jgi:maltose alpha-D-glucosyltransferase/alpha-amylase